MPDKFPPSLEPMRVDGFRIEALEPPWPPEDVTADALAAAQEAVFDQLQDLFLEDESAGDLLLQLDHIGPEGVELRWEMEWAVDESPVTPVEAVVPADIWTPNSFENLSILSQMIGIRAKLKLYIEQNIRMMPASGLAVVTNTNRIEIAEDPTQQIIRQLNDDDRLTMSSDAAWNLINGDQELFDAMCDIYPELQAEAEMAELCDVELDESDTDEVDDDNDHGDIATAEPTELRELQMQYTIGILRRLYEQVADGSFTQHNNAR